MNEYTHYVAYRNATNEIRDRVEQAQRRRGQPAPRRRSRHAIANGLHSIANRIDG